jgi:hypothetical protein
VRDTRFELRHDEQVLGERDVLGHEEVARASQDVSSRLLMSLSLELTAAERLNPEQLVRADRVPCTKDDHRGQI